MCVAAAGGEMGPSTTAAHNNTVTVLASWPRNHNSNNSHSNNNNFADCTKQPAFVCVCVSARVRPAGVHARTRKGDGIARVMNSVWRTLSARVCVCLCLLCVRPHESVCTKFTGFFMRACVVLGGARVRAHDAHFKPLGSARERARAIKT